MNVQMRDVTHTKRDGQVTHQEQIYIRGAVIRYFIIPDMLKWVYHLRNLVAEALSRVPPPIIPLSRTDEGHLQERAHVQALKHQGPRRGPCARSRDGQSRSRRWTRRRWWSLNVDDTQSICILASAMEFRGVDRKQYLRIAASDQIQRTSCS